MAVFYEVINFLSFLFQFAKMEYLHQLHSAIAGKSEGQIQHIKGKCEYVLGVLKLKEGVENF